MKKTVTILALWLFWGFALGTFILLGPVRKTVDYGREHQWSGQQENLVVFGFMSLLVILSFTIALFSSKYILSGSSKVKKGSLIAIPLLAAAFSLSLLLNPKYVNSKEQDRLSEGFTIGPYPTEEKLEELKDEGYTTVISLLHPAIVPFEPKLLSEERENTAKAGIKLINIPLLPWISDNEESIKMLRDLVKNAKGKYYVHCYLGKDRVNVAKQIILQESKKPINELQTFARSLDSIQTFERGEVFKLEDKAFFTPMPTKEEYLSYIIAAGYKQVVALKNLNEPGVQEGINEELGWLMAYKINFKVFNTGDNISEERMKKIADSIKAMPKPLVVHTFRSDQPEAELFLRLYK
ncbi:MAG: hypothetical protein H7Y13_00540 [Sphingobacteriaceae bacterium]|nr:hypothetical protein [Sphingobacteriaceae bacterium]